MSCGDCSTSNSNSNEPFLEELLLVVELILQARSKTSFLEVEMKVNTRYSYVVVMKISHFDDFDEIMTYLEVVDQKTVDLDNDEE